MSEPEFKTAIRARLPSISSSKEHLKFLREKLGEPVEVSGEDTDSPWFTYDAMDDNFPFYNAISSGEEYGVEYVLQDTTESFESVTISVEEMIRVSQEMSEKFGVEQKDIKIISCSWYNGTDEPVEW